MTSINRRTVLKGMALPLVAPLAAHAEESAASGVFQHGVASGDPTPDSVVLWTRVSQQTSDTTLHWELAADQSFSEIRQRGSVTAAADRDYTAKVVVDGLEPGRLYYYRFSLGNLRSDIGRARTLPSGEVSRLGLAIASCSNYPFGFFNAYDAIANDPQVEFVLHLGDYIYEYARDSWGGALGQRLGRGHEPANEIVTLADYRTRHAQYKADTQSRAMHAAHPLLVIWDDHESANNPWTGGAENHQPEQEGDWPTRRAAALKAWYEWMPVRDPAQDADPARYWRHLSFGDLASLVMIETRHTARSRQIDYADHAERLKTPEAARAFLDEVVGETSRRLISAEQEDFIGAAMAESVATGQPWRILGNQIPMARALNPVFKQSATERIGEDASPEAAEYARGMTRLGEFGLPLYLDPWDGYPVARERLYALCRAAGASDLLVVTGDSHSFWQNALFDADGRRMGVEVGTSGITSPGDFLGFGEWGAREADRCVIAASDEVLWTDCTRNGYVRLVLTQDAARVDYLAVSQVTTLNYVVDLLRSKALVRRDGSLDWVA